MIGIVLKNLYIH